MGWHILLFVVDYHYYDYSLYLIICFTDLFLRVWVEPLHGTTNYVKTNNIDSHVYMWAETMQNIILL